MNTKLLVGIGNPGEEYKHNRHNVGFRCVDYIADKMNIAYKHDKKKAVFGKKTIDGLNVVVLKPQTFVNLSGEAVLYLASFLRIAIKNIIIIYDEINLNFGDLKLVENNKEIEHSAILHLRKALNNDDFKCLAFGIGPVDLTMSVEDFYLSDFDPEEEEGLPGLFEKCLEEFKNFLDEN